MVNPIHFPKRPTYRFLIIGKPWVQKNNLDILYRNPRRKIGPFVDHSAPMKAARDKASADLHRQFKKQGGRKPINYFISVDLVFYVERVHEPDLDNLPAFVFDAMQGLPVRGNPKMKVAAVIVDDRLVREEHSRKVVKGDIDYDGEPRTEIVVRPYGE